MTPARALFPVLLIGALCVSLPAAAQTLPEPIVRMSEAAESAPPSRSTTNITFAVQESGVRTYQGSVRGIFMTDAGEDADAEGSFTFTFEQLRGSEFRDFFGKSKVSFGTDFKIMPSEERIYLRFTKLPKIADLDLRKITKKWAYIDVSGYDEDYSSKADISSREILEHFDEAYRKYPAVTFTEQGSMSREYVYTFRASPTTFMRLMNEAHRLAGEDPVFTTSDFNEFGYRIEPVTGTLKINKSSYLLTSLSYRLGFSYDEYRTTVTSATTYQYGPFKPVKRPSGATNFERLMDGLIGDLDEARDKGGDAALKSNLANARAEAELFYDSNRNSYEGACGTRGAYAIGDNVAAAANATGKGRGECNDTAYEWAASARLTSGTYYCVDNTGFAGEVKRKLGSATECP